MPKYPESMREQITDTVRREVFRAGIALIREEGWKAFTTEHIAARAGISRSVLYNYFENKEDIAHAIIDFSVGEMCARLESIAARPDAAANRLFDMVEVAVQDFTGQRELHRAFMAHVSPPRHQGSPPEGHRRVSELFQKVLEAGQASGEFRTDFAPAVATKLLTGGIREICFSTLFEESEPDLKGLFNVFYKGIQK